MCYGISSADTALGTIEGYLGSDFVRVPEMYVSYAEYLAWWEELLSWEIFSIELEEEDDTLPAES